LDKWPQACPKCCLARPTLPRRNERHVVPRKLPSRLCLDEGKGEAGEKECDAGNGLVRLGRRRGRVRSVVRKPIITASSAIEGGVTVAVACSMDVMESLARQTYSTWLRGAIRTCGMQSDALAGTPFPALQPQILPPSARPVLSRLPLLVRLSATRASMG